MRRLLLGLVVLCLGGCAQFPSGGVGAGAKRLVFTMTVAGVINENEVYIVALRPSRDASPIDIGPEPVIAPPWGNGFVAGNCTHFVRWDPLASPKYTLYQFQDALLTQFFAIGTPVNVVDVTTGGKTLQFELDLNQLAATPQDAALLQSIQVNFLTMDHIPQGSTGSKNWDALGDSRLPSGINQWVTIPLTSSGLYNNQRFNGLEPTGDAPDPDLDIADWSVEVRFL
ncbi:MAG: hypothetical protein HY248_01290 [Fimbriimonas ginsengisoli]|nr:hypothetical protein [Fimbriimonas ginsengisoli]